MPINWRTDYGIRLAYELARHDEGTRATVRQLSEAAEVPYDYARTIVRDLVVGGVLNSRRGVGGGVQFARPIAEVTLLDIFLALDEPVTLALCTQGATMCTRSEDCPMHNVFWLELDRMVSNYLKGVDLSRVVAQGGAPDLGQVGDTSDGV
jgi:Rrf2 family protein